MNFNEITKELINGKKVKRSCWQEGSYWEIKGEKQITNSKGESPSINAHQLQAEDWELYERDFSLSGKLIHSMWSDFLLKEDVKEFIKLLKEEVHLTYLGSNLSKFDKIIDKLAGDELKS